MNLIPRIIKNSIIKRLFKGKIIILYGARQVGKTTLVKQIISEHQGKYINCELLPSQRGLSELDPDKIKSFIGDSRLVVLDEAQNVPDIGKILKIMVDTYPEIQIIATGSSSFELAQKISEPMTGRTFTFMMHPLSVLEIKDFKDMFFVESALENLLRFGAYPEVFCADDAQAAARLGEIASNYLYKDVLAFEGLKKSKAISNLLSALALQIGSEISYQELATLLGINRLTVQKYIDILEQAFVIFQLNSFSRNKRKEISKSSKVYFWDLGIRNSLIENHNKLDIRSDLGALWENFCIVERMKLNAYAGRSANYYFWRTYTQKEIDFIEEREGHLFAYEFKWSKNKSKVPQEFLNNYTNPSFEVVNRDNYWKFLV